MIFRAEELAAATGGTLRAPGPAGTISTDSRRVREGLWFLALPGERFDGHDYLPHVLAAGCAGAIAHRVPKGWTAGFVEVADTLRALQDLGAYARGAFFGPVVGVTGSAGKTTTRAMIALIAEGLGPVYQTEGNLNSQIGVPLTLLAAPPEARVWVIEMGMDRLGQIDRLQRISRPEVRLITNVGPAHLEGVGSIEGVATAKGELFLGARPGDTCCVNIDDPRIAALPIPEGVRVLRYGRAKGADVRLTDAVVDAATLSTRYRVELAHGGAVLGTLSSPGLHLALDATAAIAAGVALRLPVEGMAARLARYEPVGMRQRIEAGPGGIRVINDAYNANPISTAAALETLSVVSGARRVALLGDMLELGSSEASAHREMVELAARLKLDLVGLAGPRYAAAAEAAGLSHHPAFLLAPDAPALGRALQRRLHAGDLVLLKGSRGTAMERVLPALAPEDT